MAVSKRVSFNNPSAFLGEKHNNRINDRFRLNPNNLYAPTGHRLRALCLLSE